METTKTRRTFIHSTRAYLWLVAVLLGSMQAWSASVTLVPARAIWRFNGSGADLGTAWQEPGYNDSGWAYGPAQLGYGDGDEATLINNSPVRPCYYFRHAFVVVDPAHYASLSLEVLRDDGCVVYLNGQEVARYNMPAGTISYSTWASSAIEYAWDAPQTIANLLVAGDNVIAVEVHQGNATSTDVSMDLKLTGTSEITIDLNAPAQGAAEVTVPATLSVTATDPQGDNLTVSFYGRPVSPPGPDFTLVALPDAQNYTAELNGGSKAIFISQTEWIRANRETLNIVYVPQFGDVSNNGDSDTDQSEWLNASDALYRIENPLPLFPEGIPYGAAVGNHDQFVPAGDTEPTTYYNQYFGITHYQLKTFYGGHYGANNNNQYQFFSASGLDFIVIYLEYDSTPDQAVLDWADGLLKSNPNRRGMVVTHYLIETTAAWGAQGQAIYNALADNPNLFLMLCGHNHGEARRTDVYSGNTVHTLLADYQDYTAGGNGYLRILQFSPSNNEIRVKTYSPWVNQYETDAGSQFTLSYPMTTGPAFALVQQNAGVPSGTATSAAWTGLQPASDYEWYVAASDGTETKSSELRRFTTSANTPPTVAITSPVDGALFDTDPASITITADSGDVDGQVTKVEFFAGAAKLGEDTEAPYELTYGFPLGAYTLTAVATDNGGAQAVSGPASITVGGPPPAPADLLATAQSATEILLTWTDISANENGFEVYRVNGGSYAFMGTTGPDVASALVTGLQPSTTYYYVVRAFNGAGHADSAVAGATTLTPPPVPAAPSGLSAAPWSSTEIALAWADNSSDESSFQIERSPDGTAWAPLAAVTADTASVRDTGLASGTVYYYRVLACNGSGCSAPSSMAAAAPYVDSYATSETLAAGTLVGTRGDTYANDAVYEQLTEKPSGGKPNTRYNTLQHKWTFNATPGKSVIFYVQAHQTPSSDGDNFNFAYSTDDLNYQQMVEVSVTADGDEYQAFALPATLQGTVYVRVQDTDHTVGSTALDTLFVDHLLIRTDASPVMSPPPAPVLQQATAGDQTVTLTWTSSGGATSYRIWRRSDSGGYAEIASGVAGTTYTDTSVMNGTTFEYVVTAVNVYGESGASNALSVTPQMPTVTEPPSNLKATSARKKITLSWTPSATPGVTQNKIYRSPTGNNGTYVLLNTIAVATAYADAVASGSTFYYVVTAVSASGASVPSSAAFATAK